MVRVLRISEAEYRDAFHRHLKELGTTYEALKEKHDTTDNLTYAERKFWVFFGNNPPRPECDCGHEFSENPSWFHLGVSCAYYRSFTPKEIRDYRVGRLPHRHWYSKLRRLVSRSR